MLGQAQLVREHPVAQLALAPVGRCGARRPPRMGDLPLLGSDLLLETTGTRLCKRQPAT